MVLWLSNLVQEALNSLLPVIADYQWCLEIDESLVVQGHAVYLEIVLKNLIENARKYSAPELHISIVTTQLEKHIRITIADRGKGMTESELARAAERFYRADKCTIEGAGVGSWICHKILQLHNGTMEMRPREGGGLEVIIYLPGAVH
ncbi:MAG: ATP-binding protein [Shewanella sp.]|nr:ATP-binding protein [Shewanella sp.]MCF1431104.1 ATP-binding protein [Shewanella sp.]MCF1439885.1 ATP-binding protein [Shewanella sp.]MCF1458929.1 ATP-binding protein [Shewanella sp.]